MTKIISFISRKGGIGKTTNAINLSSILHNLGHKVILLEADPNYTLNTLRQMELFKTGANNSTIFKITGIDEKDVIEELNKIKKDKYDFVIVDSAGKTTDESIKKLCIESDMVIVPTSLSQNDLLVTYQTVEDIIPAQILNPKLKILVLPNRIHSSTRIGTISKTLSEIKGQILPVVVPMKNIYANFSTILPEKEYLPIAQEILKNL